MPVLLNQAPMPVSDRVANLSRYQGDPQEGLITPNWIEYFNRLIGTVDLALTAINTASVTGQEAAISATDFSGGSLSGGLYVAAYYVRITQAAGTSSAVTVTLDWTDGAATPTYSGVAVNGNTTNTMQSGVQLIHVDANSPVRYQTTYASAGSPVMKYRLDLALVRVALGV